MHFISENILRAICWTLLHSLWQGLILAIAAGLVMVLCRKQTALTRYNLLCLLLVVFLASGSYTFYRQLSEPTTLATNTHTQEAGMAHQNDMQPGLQEGPITGVSVQNGITSFVAYFNSHAPLIVLIWFIIFLARFTRILSGLIYVQRIRHSKTRSVTPEWQDKFELLLTRLKIHQTISLLESTLVKVPVVVGFLKPVILIPAGMLIQLSPVQVESILVHELAHIHRRDYLINMLQNLADVVYFFNPSFLWISSLIRNERENCCDDIAIRETKSRKQFVEALVSFHEYSKSAPGYALSFAAKENQLVNRVKRIVNKKNQSLHPVEQFILAGGLFVLCAAGITISNSRAAGTTKKKTVNTAVTASVVSPKNTAFQNLILETGKDTTPVKIKPKANANREITKPVNKTMHDKSAGDENRPVDQSNEDQPLGFKNLTAQQLLKCAEHGVTADFVNEFRKMGYRNISPDKAIELKDHGVDPEFIKSFTDLGYKNITLEKAIELEDHGVRASFIKSFSEKGYGILSLDKATELIDHGVSLTFMESFRQLGFKNITPAMGQELKDHGVTSDFIEAMKKKTGSLFELDEYIRLRDGGIDPS
jgi:bla regulator protein BlaR1